MCVLSNLTPASFARARYIYLPTRVMYVGDVELKAQSFSARFDLHVMWRPSHALDADFSPIIRFPEATSWSEVARVDISKDYAGELNGFRATIEGRFRTDLDLRMFPFDAHPLTIEMQLGRDSASGLPLSHSTGWRLAHNPVEPNLLVAQIQGEYVSPMLLEMSAPTACLWEMFNV